SILTKITDFLGGGTVGAIAGVVKDYFPPSMSDKEKADLSLRITEAENAKDLKTMALVNEAQAEFNRRIVDLEGSAADLKAIPVIGHILILLRGAQRPIWGLFTLYADYQAWSSVWTLTEKQEAMLLAVNILVLGFLFGERAVKNVMPFVVQFFGKK
ncbi:unnamed protein product, partial [marine sediment metagenome]